MRTHVRAIMVVLALSFALVSGCRLPVDVNINQYPGLKFVAYRLDGRPFEGVTVTVADPANSDNTNSNGEVTLLVYRDAVQATVTFSWWQRTPDGTRTQTATYYYGLPSKGVNIYAITLPDRALY